MEGLVAGRIVYFVVGQYIVDQFHSSGNAPTLGDIVPAMVVKVWSDTCVNLKLFLDGPENAWVTSVVYSETNAPATWHWMYNGQSTRGQAK